MYTGLLNWEAKKSKSQWIKARAGKPGSQVEVSRQWFVFYNSYFLLVPNIINSRTIVTPCQDIVQSPKWKWPYVSARLAFRLRRPLSLFNFTHLWFRFQRSLIFYQPYICYFATWKVIRFVADNAPYVFHLNFSALHISCNELSVVTNSFLTTHKIILQIV